MKYRFSGEVLKGALLAILLLTPFAQERVVFFGVPWYLPEVLTLVAIFVVIFLLNDFPSTFFRRDMIFFALLFIICGLFLSALLNDMTPHGYGRIKSWFLFPVLYGGALSFALRNKLVSVEAVLRSMFFGGIFVGVITVAIFIQGGAFSYDHRLKGGFPSPNHLAFLLGAAIIAGIFLLLCHWKVLKGWYFGIVFGEAVLFVLFFLTQSYAALSAFFIGGLIVLFRYEGVSFKRKLLFGIAAVILCLSGLFYAGESKWQSLMTLNDRSSLSSRIMIWQSASWMIRDHPLIGIGPGNFQKEYIAYQRYFPPYLEWSAPHPHNAFLDIWLEGGVLGFFGLMLFFGTWVFLSVRFFWQQDKKNPLMGLPFLFACYFLLTGLMDVPFLRNDLAYFLVTAFVFSGALITNGFDRFSHRGD